MGYDDRAMFEKTTVWWGESATEWLLKLIVGRSGTQLRTQKPDSCDPLAAILGADGSARGCRSAGTAGFRDSINPSTCFAMVNTWKHGISQVRRYDPYGPGDVAKYLSKGRFSSAADCEYANTYELRKFHRADWIYISPGAWAENAT